MQSDVLKKIIKDIKIAKEEYSEEKIVFGKRGYNSFVINKNNFEEVYWSDERKRIAFVDGGNCEIIGSTNFSVQLIRVYCCVFESNKKIDEIKNEFFVLADSFVENEDVFYKINVYPLKGDFVIDNFSINSMDSNISEGGKRAKIAKTGEIARRIAEIRAAEMVVGLGRCDAVVMDGTLGCDLGENKYLDKLYEKGLIKDTAICALAKTTNLFTDKGNNALSSVARLGEDGVWSCNNFVDIENAEHKADMSIVKLNDRSKHCFRFEIFKKQKEHKKSVLGCLLDNCRDISFPGYPYGLILADKFARVSNKEKEYLQNILLLQDKEQIKQIIEETRTNDSHRILDSIN